MLFHTSCQFRNSIILPFMYKDILDEWQYAGMYEIGTIKNQHIKMELHSMQNLIIIRKIFFNV